MSPTILATTILLAAATVTTGCGTKDPSSLHVANARVEASSGAADPMLRFVVDNRLNAADALVSITTPDADAVTVDDGPTHRGTAVDISPGEPVRFEAGAHLARLERPARTLDVGDQVEVTFTFESGIQITVQAPVVAAGTPGTDQEHR